MAILRGLCLPFLTLLAAAAGLHRDATQHQQPLGHALTHNGTLISQKLFWELEELARIVDIAYCVGTAGLGIQKPFKCASRCGDKDFESFELVTVGPASGMTCRTELMKIGMEYWPFPVRLVWLRRPVSFCL